MSVPRWRAVELIGLEGTEVGIVEDRNGILVITSRRPGEEWPHGMVPKGGLNVIALGATMWAVMTKEDE